jgi:hypothetical protein
MSRLSSALVLVLVLVACGDDAKEEPLPFGLEQTEVTETCSTGLMWSQGVDGSPHMLPGANCLNCHQGGIQPNFHVAGTIHGALGDEDACAGVEGVQVEITDVTGETYTFETNAAGNFYGVATDIQPPYRATLRYEGRERSMNFEVNELACNRCHAQVGVDGAPGRILVP